jgi:hypothetical protein
MSVNSKGQQRGDLGPTGLSSHKKTNGRTYTKEDGENKEANSYGEK